MQLGSYVCGGARCVCQVEVGTPEANYWRSSISRPRSSCPHLLSLLLPHSLFVPRLQDEMRYRKYDVWISDGADEPLPEYKVDYNKKEHTATCYIPSESGKVRPAVHVSDECATVPLTAARRTARRSLSIART